MAATPPSVTGLYVGASGFSYPTWRGVFYPAGSRPSEFLGIYSAGLPSVELNTTFYQLPAEEQLAAWRDQVPEGFRFAVKMTRRITHFGRYELIGTFCERVRTLGDRLGPVLIQFPPTLPRDDGLLELVLGSLDPELRYAFEFRNETWEGVHPALDGTEIALVGSLEGPSAFRYLRLREPPYDERSLREWAGRLRPLLAAGIEVYAYFKHEDEPTAPLYAQRLEQLLAGPDTATV